MESENHPRLQSAIGKLRYSATDNSRLLENGNVLGAFWFSITNISYPHEPVQALSYYTKILEPVSSAEGQKQFKPSPDIEEFYTRKTPSWEGVISDIRQQISRGRYVGDVVRSLLAQQYVLADDPASIRKALNYVSIRSKHPISEGFLRTLLAEFGAVWREWLVVSILISTGEFEQLLESTDPQLYFDWLADIEADPEVAKLASSMATKASLLAQPQLKILTGQAAVTRPGGTIGTLLGPQSEFSKGLHAHLTNYKPTI